MPFVNGNANVEYLDRFAKLLNPFCHNGALLKILECFTRNLRTRKRVVMSFDRDVIWVIYFHFFFLSPKFNEKTNHFRSLEILEYLADVSLDHVVTNRKKKKKFPFNK